MISVAEARARILQGIRPTAPETVSLADAAGRVLATPVVARRTQPPDDVSAMDGYALRGADAVAGARLHVIGAAPAGHPFHGTVGAGQAVRVFTGGVVPAGADTVLIQEDADSDGDHVLVRVAAQPARHIRRAGQDFGLGDAVLNAGRKLTPRDIGLAAAADHPWLTVHRRPRVAILATGDELALPGEKVGPGGIIGSNGVMLAALVAACGGVASVVPVVRDDAAAIAEAANLVRGTDLLITTGGASVGEHDLVQDALCRQGFVLDFWKIAMRPGKPLIFGRLGDMPVLGLPGNPVSALVCSELFLRPLLATLSGQPPAPPATHRARLGAALRTNDHRADHLRATLRQDGGDWIATPFPHQDSAMQRVLSEADCLILRAPHAPAIEAGQWVDVMLLSA